MFPQMFSLSLPISPNLYCIVYSDLYSASHSKNKTEALFSYFSVFTLIRRNFPPQIICNLSMSLSLSHSPDISHTFSERSLAETPLQKSFFPLLDFDFGTVSILVSPLHHHSCHLMSSSSQYPNCVPSTYNVM